MLISVIIPYKNAGEYIARCADSLRQQTGEFEFIFVNDGSDGEFETDDRFVLVHNKHHPGVSGARNTGMDIAHGEWITFLDADDVLLPNAYKKFASAIKEDPEADVHQFNHVRYYTTNQHSVVKYVNSAGRYGVPNLPKCWFYVWNKLYRAEFVKDIRFDETIQFGEDGLFVFECLSKGAAINHDKLKVTTVKHIFENENSLSHRKTFEDILKQIRTYLLFMERQSDSDLRLLVGKEIAKILNKQSIQKVISDAKE